MTTIASAVPSLLGAEGALELVAALSGAAEGRCTVVRPVGNGGPGLVLTLRLPAAHGEDAGPSADTNPAPLLDRYVLRLAPRARRAATAPVELFPADTVVLTDRPALLAGSNLPTGTLIVDVSDHEPVLRAVGGGTVAADDGIEAAIRAASPRHVRVLADLSGVSTPTAAILRLHDAAFVAAKACAAGRGEIGTFLVLLLSGVDARRVPNPCAGLFTGFVKSLALEWAGTRVVAVGHEAGDLAQAGPDAAAELSAEQLLPVVYIAGGTRLTWQAVQEQGVPESPGCGHDDVIFAAGGARGIGAELLTALARRDRPRIHLVGSTRLDDYDLTVLAAPEPPSRAEFIRACSTGTTAVSVAQANIRFNALTAAREVHANLAELERLCGPGRVTYHPCDLRDAEQVRRTVSSVLTAEGRVDLVLVVAGTNRAASVEVKTLADFRLVRDLKVGTYTNLKAAFAGRAPRRWCNFGSFVGFTGQVGETDYGAANDYLNTAAGHAAAGGAKEFTIGWTLWQAVGLGATPLMRTFLAKSGQFTAMPTAEGVGHFLHELDLAPAPASVLFGAAERAAITRALPGYLDFCRERDSCGDEPPPPSLPYVDEILSRSADEVVVGRTFDLTRDGYLLDHVVNGYPTLPGTFVPELAAQAAMMLVPGRVPVVIEDVRLESFLRVYRDDRPERKRIRARLVRSDERESVVAVDVLGDVVAPNGQVLRRDRRHFSAVVRLRDEPVAPPRWEQWDDHGAERLADPYHVANPAVVLSGVFVSTSDTRTHPLGRRARLSLDQAGIERWFSGLIVPSVLLDGLARVSVLERVDGDWTPLAVPRTIRRIDLYGRHTDASLARAGTSVELYSLPASLDLTDAVPDNRALAVAADGAVLLQIKDMTGVVLGHVHQGTGEYRPLDREVTR